MKNKRVLLALGILGVILLVTALVIAHGNQSQEKMGNMKRTSEMMAGMMGNTEDEMHNGGMMRMMQGMMNSGELKKMHKEMIAKMKEHIDELEGDEKQEAKEMIEHMEGCPMMK